MFGMTEADVEREAAYAKVYPDNAGLTGRQTRSVDEVAVILGISRRTAYRMVGEGTIPSIRMGKRLLVTLTTIRALLGEAPA